MTDRILDAMARAAANLYGGEAVSELEHALQCAELAEQARAGEEMMLAALLHDVGRYAVDQSLVADRLDPSAPPAVSGTPPAGSVAAIGGAGRPRGHHEVGAELIAPWVPARVAWCVRAHADAKRYLCAIEPSYYDRLSPGSRHTLALQGGVMSPAEAARFAGHRWVADAVALRRWDDAAKAPGEPTRPLGAWEPLLRRYFDGPPAPRERARA